MLGRGHISHFSEYVLSSTLSINSTLIAIMLRYLHTPSTLMIISISITFNKHINEFKKIWYQNGIYKNF